jgi:phosphoribosyl 1,2-cyclic phosphodiesterase
MVRYGGNTSCVVVDVPAHDPILFDLGTGARNFGAAWPTDVAFRGSCLLSHLHWDHVQGLPFFPPVLRPGGRLDLYGPAQPGGRSIGDVIETALCPPLFPVGVTDLPGEIVCHELTEEELVIGDVRVVSRLVPHLGPTLGYRLEWNGASVVYISDHQQPGVDVYDTTGAVRELCRSADVLIHDAQYTRPEFEQKSGWGHCTIDFAVWLAHECSVGTLVLYHHDPTHDDDRMDELADHARSLCSRVNVLAAQEGLTIELGG